MVINKVVYGGETLIDLTNDTITQSAVLENTQFHAPNGEIKQGTMPNRHGLIETLETLDDVCAIPEGYHDGSGQVSIAQADRDKLIAENIREGIKILGVTGAMDGMEGVKATTLTTTPKLNKQIITPEGLGDFNSITQVTINPIPIIETDNIYGGKTVTIGIGGE